MSVTVVADGLKQAKAYLEAAPARFAAAARLSLNTVARGPGRKLFAQAMMEQIDFPNGYINNDRLFVSQPARDGNLEVIMTARQRPTSLARFAAESVGSKTKGVHVQVKAQGGGKFMPGAFLVRLKTGKVLDADNYNVGLAIRLKPGQVINKREFNGIQLSHNVYLLYGPSVDQVFREVASEETEPFLDLVETEFFRQFARLSDAS